MNLQHRFISAGEQPLPCFFLSRMKRRDRTPRLLVRVLTRKPGLCPPAPNVLLFSERQEMHPPPTVYPERWEWRWSGEKTLRQRAAGSGWTIWRSENKPSMGVRTPVPVRRTRSGTEENPVRKERLCGGQIWPHRAPEKLLREWPGG